MINDIIHSKPRLLIMLTLNSIENGDFNFLKEKLKFTDGVLSVHIKKLEQAGYVKIKKRFINNKPNTRYQISSKGKNELLEYIKEMKEVFDEM